MAPTPTTVQRKHGVGLFKPFSWNQGRRFTSPGPMFSTNSNTDGPVNILNCEVRTHLCNIGKDETIFGTSAKRKCKQGSAHSIFYNLCAVQCTTVQTYESVE